jgi:hypothetical protein
MKEYRPLNPPEEVEEIEYIKCDWCEDKFIEGQIMTLSFGKYCKNCCDEHVENNIKYGFSDSQINKDMKEFKEQYLLTFKTQHNGK